MSYADISIFEIAAVRVEKFTRCIISPNGLCLVKLDTVFSEICSIFVFVPFKSHD